MSLCASYQMVTNPVVYVNACNKLSVLLAHTQFKANRICSDYWLRPLETGIFADNGMQMHNFQSILKCKIGHAYVLPCMICINYYSLCSS